MGGCVSMRVMMLSLFLCLGLMVANSAAECPSAIFLPSDVLENFEDNTVTDQLAEQIASLEAKVPSVLKSFGIETYAVTVVYGNSTIYSTGLVDVPFRVASVTKIFTAMGALVLRQQGRLALDDPVTKFLPTFSVINPYKKKKMHDITLRELMGHLSGLPRELGEGWPAYEEGILRWIAQMELVRPPWTGIPYYNNLGFALLGHAWEKATSPRQSWDEFLRTAILGPLDMDDTGSDFVNLKKSFAPGSIGTNPSNTSIGWLGPTGDMYSTALDLTKFLKFLLRPDEEVLSEAAIREWIKPTTVFPAAASSDPPSLLWGGFALPWELISLATTDNQSTTVISKAGLIGTYRSIIAFHPDSQLGVVVLVSVMNDSLAALDFNNLNYPARITTEILQGLIPEVESIHWKLISALYSGVYTCKRSPKPTVSPNFANVTYQVLEGSINVTVGKALIAKWNITALQSNVEAHLVYSASLVVKSAPEHEFWAYSESCSVISTVLGFDVEIARPNFPGSVFMSELRFDPEQKLVRWPGIGAECYKT